MFDASWSSRHGGSHFQVHEQEDSCQLPGILQHQPDPDLLPGALRLLQQHFIFLCSEQQRQLCGGIFILYHDARCGFSSLDCFRLGRIPKENYFEKKLQLAKRNLEKCSRLQFDVHRECDIQPHFLFNDRHDQTI